jgi:hypothetical protein
MYLYHYRMTNVALIYQKRAQLSSLNIWEISGWFHVTSLGWDLILMTLKVVKFCPFFKFFLVRCKLPFFGQNCSLPFSLRSLDSPALLKSLKKHYPLYDMRNRSDQNRTRDPGVTGIWSLHCSTMTETASVASGNLRKQVHHKITLWLVPICTPGWTENKLRLESYSGSLGNSSGSVKIKCVKLLAYWIQIVFAMY